MISVDDALVKLLENAKPCCETEIVPIYKGLSRVLSEPVRSSVSVPPTDNSAMDGYAVIASSIKVNTNYQVSQRIPAGTAPSELTPGTVARIFTGAEIPANADGVIIQENAVIQENGSIRFIQGAEAGDNIRRKGQDVTEDSEILTRGSRLRPQEIGLLASCGVSEISVYKKLRVAVISTGDELVEVGEPLQSGQIYNSNRYLLAALIQESGFDYVDIGLIKDSLVETKTALIRAAELADVVITTGGVSVGEEDHVKAAVEEIGSLNLWKVAIKPGKPLAFGHLQKVAGAEKRETKLESIDFIGLPGNPSSVFATFLILALPRLQIRQGLLHSNHLAESYPAKFDRAEVGRREFLRARRYVEDGKTVVDIYPNQSSGVLSSACWGDGFAVQMENKSIVSGQLIEFIPYQNLFS